MKRLKRKYKLLSLRVYGILDKKLREITKVSLDKKELIFEMELDNSEGNLVLCDFYVSIDIPL